MWFPASLVLAIGNPQGKVNSCLMMSAPRPRDSSHWLSLGHLPISELVTSLWMKDYDRPGLGDFSASRVGGGNWYPLSQRVVRVLLPSEVEEKAYGSNEGSSRAL